VVGAVLVARGVAEQAVEFLEMQPPTVLAALLLTIIGGVNWLLVGAADIDLVARLLCAGTTPARAVYILVGIAALYCLSFIPHVSHERDVIPTR
jgi:hypothetical protein